MSDENRVEEHTAEIAGRTYVVGPRLTADNRIPLGAKGARCQNNHAHVAVLSPDGLSRQFHGYAIICSDCETVLKANERKKGKTT
jgi:hypothetical protein